MTQTSFEIVGGHFIVVPVTVHGTFQQRFILDTGIGVNLISKSLCDRVDCKISSQYTGKRMSGQELKIKMSKLAALTFASQTQRHVRVGVIDMEKLLPRDWEIDGFLSLHFFKHMPMTIDYAEKMVWLETNENLAQIISEGHSAEIHLEQDGPSLSLFLSLLLGGEILKMQVDTGSDALILHERFMKGLGVNPDSEGVKRVKGTDETGHKFMRTCATVAGPLSLVGAPSMAQHHFKAIFQNTIHDGLIGRSYLSRFRVTYDLEHSRVIFRSLKRDFQ